MAAIDLDLAVAFVRQPARAVHRDHAVMLRPEREGRHFGTRRGVEVDRGIVDRMTRDQMIEAPRAIGAARSEEHTSELQSLMRNSYAVFCLKKKKKRKSTRNIMTSK